MDISLDHVQWVLKEGVEIQFNTPKPLQVSVESVLEERRVEMFQLC
jgi:hypothetical protein